MKGLVILILIISIAAAPAPSISQTKIACGASSMLTSFIPCMSFLINSNPNESLPTNKCCQALRTLTAGEMDCFCIFLNSTASFSFPIERILAPYLQVCGISDVLLLHCKTYLSLSPASGPVSPGQSPSTPSEFTSLPHLKEASPVIPPTFASSSEAPLSDATLPMHPSSSPLVVSNTSSSTMASGGHSLLTPSSSMPSCTVSTSFLLIAFGPVVLKYY